jgi:hypothetical protein
MTLLAMCMDPLYDGGMVLGSGDFVGSVGFELIKKSPLAQLRARASDKFDASLCIWRYMSLIM